MPGQVLLSSRLSGAHTRKHLPPSVERKMPCGGAVAVQILLSSRLSGAHTRKHSPLNVQRKVLCGGSDLLPIIANVFMNIQSSLNSFVALALA